MNRTKRQPVPAKRAHIVDVAMRHFAEHGYEDARTEDIAREAGSPKARSFSISETNKGSFWLPISVRRGRFSRYLDAPAEIRTKGFWGVLRYWLARTELQVRANWQPYRVALLGNYGTGPAVKAGYQSLSGGGGSIRNRGLCAPGIEGRRAASGCR